MERLIKETKCTEVVEIERKRPGVAGKELAQQRGRERKGNSLADVSNLGCGTVQSSFAGEKSSGS